MKSIKSQILSLICLSAFLSCKNPPLRPIFGDSTDENSSKDLGASTNSKEGTVKSQKTGSKTSESTDGNKEGSTASPPTIEKPIEPPPEPPLTRVPPVEPPVEPNRTLTELEECQKAAKEINFGSLGNPEEITLPRSYDFLEGPVWIAKEKALWVSAWNYSDASEGKGPPTTILQYSSGTWKTVSEKGLIRSNGMAVNSKGQVVAALHDTETVAVISPPASDRTILAQKYNDKNFNSPNDLALRADDTLYFTDPNYQQDSRPGQGNVTGVYGVKPAGEVFVVDSGRDKPNGIALSPDAGFLYVGAADGKIQKYKIGADGKAVFDSTFAMPNTNIDGMTVDCAGNVYASLHEAKRVEIYNDAGKSLGSISLRYNVTNVAFGGEDQKTLFITTAGHLFKLSMGLKGSPY